MTHAWQWDNEEDEKAKDEDEAAKDFDGEEVYEMKGEKLKRKRRVSAKRGSANM